MLQPTSYSVEGYADRNEYEYNSSGDVTARYVVNASGKQNGMSNTYKYEYDNNNNWTKKTISGLSAGYVTRKIEYYTAPSLSYKNDVQQISTPALQRFGALVKDAYSKSADKTTLLDSEKKMVANTRTAIEKLRKVPDLDGNNAKKLTLELLQYTIEASTLRKIQDIINGAPDSEAGYREIAGETVKRRKEIMAELSKLK